NLVSGNAVDGIGFGHGSSIVVRGNLIGTDASGLHGLPNLSNGVTLGATTNVTIGGTNPGDRNVISGNNKNPGNPALGIGIGINANNTTGTLVQGNYIGVGSDGSTPLGNSIGVAVYNGTGVNTIGGTTAAARNVISGNAISGVQVGNQSNT